MKKFKKTQLILFVFVALLSSCTRKETLSSGGSDDFPNCVVTQVSYEHIRDRHCVPGQGTQLLPKYCTWDGMKDFCKMVQDAPVKNVTVQPDGRVRYDANLGVVVGVGGEKCGRLILMSADNGNVITEFPEGAGAPGNCY